MKPVAKEFEAKRCVMLRDVPLHNCPYIPQAGDVVLAAKNMSVTEHVLSSGFHIHTMIYVGITWTSNTFTLLWKPYDANNTVSSRLEGFYPVGHMKAWKQIVECYYHPFDNPFTPVEMPCKIDNFWKYSGINLNSLATITAKEAISE